MRDHNFIAIIFCCLAAVLLVGWYSSLLRNDAVFELDVYGAAAEFAPKYQNSIEEKIALHPNFYDKVKFYEALDFVYGVESEINIRAMIVPHDVAAGKYAAALMKRAGGREIENVFLVGPNHDNVGDYPIASCLSDWETPFGIIKANRGKVQDLAGFMNINLSADVFKAEHSIGALAPYVKHFYPRAQMIPIVLSSYIDMPKAELLADWLQSTVGKNDLVIFSIDFSHYLSKSKADEMDEITINIINSYKLGEIFSLGNDNVDSPGALAVGLLLAGKNNWQKELVYRSNSFDLSEIKTSQTTSHLSYLFYD
jgi:MEMO1 family protein